VWFCPEVRRARHHSTWRVEDKPSAKRAEKTCSRTTFEEEGSGACPAAEGPLEEGAAPKAKREERDQGGVMYY